MVGGQPELTSRHFSQGFEKGGASESLARAGRWTLACAGVTPLDLPALPKRVIPAKAGIHEFSHRL